MKAQATNDLEHLSVLSPEVIEALVAGPGGLYVDATLGLGGHSERILQASEPDGRVLGIDVDPDAIERAQTRLGRFGSRVSVVQGNFRDLLALAARAGVSEVDGVLFDLGVSSLQLSAAGRGFSFRYAAPLDMRMDPTLEQTAADLVNGLDESELTAMLRQYGEEPAAARISRSLVRQRPFQTTIELADAIELIAPRRGARIHPATRTFQALRMVVNAEIESLQEALEACLRLLRIGGRLVVISFHSIEDRLVKGFLRRESRDCLCPPALPVCMCSHRASLRLLSNGTRKPSAAEVATNPRSRSARLRVAERIGSARVGAEAE